MIDVLHPKSLWGTGAPFMAGGKMNSHPSAPVPLPGQSVCRDVEHVPVGSLVCRHLYLTEPKPPGIDFTSVVWTFVECVEKDWGSPDTVFLRPSVTYDLVVVRNDDVVCPLCLLREVMES